MNFGWQEVDRAPEDNVQWPAAMCGRHEDGDSGLDGGGLHIPTMRRHPWLTQSFEDLLGDALGSVTVFLRELIAERFTAFGFSVLRETHWTIEISPKKGKLTAEQLIEEVTVPFVCSETPDGNQCGATCPSNRSTGEPWSEARCACGHSCESVLSVPFYVWHRSVMPKTMSSTAPHQCIVDRSVTSEAVTR